MHRLIVFDESSALAADGWRLRASEIVDLSDAVETLAHCRRRLTEVEQQCEARFEQARAEGLAAGMAEGQIAGRAEATRRLEDFLATWAEERRRNQAIVGRLAMDVARRLLGEIEEERSIALFAVRRFEELEDKAPLLLRVPVGCGSPVERRLRDRGVRLQVAEDSALGPDECAFELSAGTAHSGIRLQLEALEAMVAKVEASLVLGESHVA